MVYIVCSIYKKIVVWGVSVRTKKMFSKQAITASISEVMVTAIAN